MDGEIGDALLADEDVRLESQNVGAHLLDLHLLLVQHLLPVLLLRDLQVGLALALLVLHGCVHQQHAGVLNAPPHAPVGHILVEHDAVQDAAVLQLTSRQLQNHVNSTSKGGHNVTQQARVSI